MIDKFWESVGGKLADRWAIAAAPAVVFWLGGLLAWMDGQGGRHALAAGSGWLGRQSTPVQVMVALGLLIGVVASGLMVSWAGDPALRVLEGYLPWPSGAPRRALVDRSRRRAARIDAELHDLQGPVTTGEATPEQRARFQRLDRQRRDLPSHPDRSMPTRVGNILRAAESRPVDRYGLDAVAVWPHLWLLLPGQARSDLLAARTKLDGAVAGLLWGVLFTAFTAWSWWALPAGAAVAAFTHSVLLPDRARTFGCLFEATIDLYRTELYRQLRWPMPPNPQAEIRAGRLLTKYLVRGIDAAEPMFTDGRDPGR